MRPGRVRMLEKPWYSVYARTTVWSRFTKQARLIHSLDQWSAHARQERAQVQQRGGENENQQNWTPWAYLKPPRRFWTMYLNPFPIFVLKITKKQNFFMHTLKYIFTVNQPKRSCISTSFLHAFF